MKNIKGQKTNFGTILVIAIIALAVLYMFGAFDKTPTGDDGGTIIITNPVELTFSGYNKLQPGTTFTPTTVSVSVEGSSFDDTITQVSGGDRIEILAEEALYHSAYIAPMKVPENRATMIISIPFYLDATAAEIVIYNEENQIADQTASVGASYDLPVRFRGEDLASTQHMRCILEAEDGTLLRELKLTGFGAVFKGTFKPSWHVAMGVDSGFWVYDINPIEGANSVMGSIRITGRAGETLAGTDVGITCYTKDHFIDDFTGKHMYDVEDSQGDLQGISDYDQAISFV